MKRYYWLIGITLLALLTVGMLVTTQRTSGSSECAMMQRDMEVARQLGRITPSQVEQTIHARYAIEPTYPIDYKHQDAFHSFEWTVMPWLYTASYGRFSHTGFDLLERTRVSEEGALDYEHVVACLGVPDYYYIWRGTPTVGESIQIVHLVFLEEGTEAVFLMKAKEDLQAALPRSLVNAIAYYDTQDLEELLLRTVGTSARNDEVYVQRILSLYKPWPGDMAQLYEVQP
jgi:hypothetical protein